MPNVPVILPVLANDSDPNGDILSIASIDVRDETGLKVEVLQRQYLRITATRPVKEREPALFRYTLSDGNATATGVVVVHGLASSLDRSPLVTDDALSLRVGRLGAARVLDNDVDPEGGPLTLEQPAPDPKTGRPTEMECIDNQGEPCPAGTAFVEGNKLRVVAPLNPTRLTIAYTALDAGGAKGAGRLVVNVVDNANQAPQPPAIEVRTVIGRPIDVVIPVGSADPDGDVVAFAGLLTPPRRGVISEPDKDGLVEAKDGKREKAQRNALRYVPRSPGTDVFTYSVVDPEGLVGVGTVLVGVLPATAQGRPLAVPDTADVEPGGMIEFDVLANDSDPDNDPIRIVDSPASTPNGANIDLRRQLIVVRGNANWENGTLVVPYRIADDQDQTSDSTLTVRVRSKSEIQGKPPVAVDDILEPVAAGQRVRVDALENDFDPDGDITAYTVTYAPPLRPDKFRVSKAGVPLSFTMPKGDVQIRYTVTDTKRKQSASAVIMVPLKQPDQLRTTPDTDRVAPGESVVLDVVKNDEPSGKVKLDTVYDAVGGTVKLTDGKAEFTALPKASGPEGVGGFKYKVLLDNGENPPKSAVGVATITILSKDNHAPTISPLNIDLAAGEEKEVDLAKTVTDIDPDDTFKFDQQATSPAKQITAGMNGSTLKLKASDEAFEELEGSPLVTITVGGTDNGDPAMKATGQVIVRMLGSTKPLPVANADIVEEPVLKNKSGKTKIEVLANDSGEGLRLVSFDPIDSSMGKVDKAGDALEYTPPAQGTPFFGKVTFNYTMVDKYTEKGRQQTAAVTLTVIDIPAKPGTPVATNTGSRQTTLSWSFPENDKHGDTIDHFQVEASGFSQACNTNTNCLITKLTNGNDYRFTVKACGVKTAPDCSAASDQSDVVSPNKAPDDPVLGQTVEGDKELTVNWTQPATNEDSGSAVTEYVITLSPGSQSTLPASDTSKTFTGLVNGTDYTVSLYANNRGDGKTKFKSNTVTTAALRPYGVPIWGSAKPVGKDLGNGTLEVSWTAPDANGRAVDGFDVTQYRDGAVYNTQHVSDGSATQTTFPGTAVGNSNYTFSLVAHNLRGNSTASPTSAAVKAAGPPLQISSVTAATGDTKATLTFTAPDNQGSEITSYKVTTSPATSQPSSFSGPASGPVNLTVNSLTNGTQYTFTVAACNTNQSANKCGNPSPASNAITPFGAPGTPGVSGQNSGQGDTTARWTWSAPNANGKAIIRYEVSVDNGGRENVGNVTSFSRSFGYSQTHNLRVWAINNDSPRSESANPGSANATTGSQPPQPSVTVSWGAKAPASICNNDTSCTYVTISWSNFSSGNHTITPYLDGQGDWCPPSCADSQVRSGSSGTYTGYWAAGWCNQNHYVTATVDGVGSNQINTNDHSC